MLSLALDIAVMLAIFAHSAYMARQTVREDGWNWYARAETGIALLAAGGLGLIAANAAIS